MTDNQQPLIQQEQNSGIDLQELFYRCLAKWYWFLITLVLSFGIGVLIIMSTPPVYQRYATVLIKDDQSARNTNIERQFSQLGLINSSAVSNELLAFQSPSLMEAVIKRLQLDVNYSTEGFFYNPTLYGSNLPLKILFLTLQPEDAARLTVTYTQQGSVQLSGFEGSRTGQQFKDQIVQGRIGQTINTPIGRIIVSPTPHFSKLEVKPILVTRNPLEATLTAYNRANIALADKNADMLNITFQDLSAERATDVINALIDAYNEAWLSDKKEIAQTTSKFINERLQIIEAELGNVDRRISNYKSANLMSNAEAASELYMRKTEDNHEKLTNLESQLYMAQFVQSAVGSEGKNFEILPANSGLHAPAIEAMIAEHNRDVLDRNRIVLNSSTANSRVQELDDRIIKQRQAIIASVNNLIVTLQTQIRSLRTQEGNLTSKIAQAPKQSSFLTSIGREQEVKSTLYIFLLQKREENELSSSFTALNTRLITPPTGSSRPISPIKRNILLGALFIGILLPLLYFYLRELLNTRVRTRRDLESLTIPYIGEIPQIDGKSPSWWTLLMLRLGLRKTLPRTDRCQVVVEPQNSNLINNAFRVVRSNFEFVVERQERGLVTMVVSSEPASGKTFVTMNLAMSMLLKGKRTLVIDFDLRKAAASLFVNRPKLGVSNVLSGQCEWREVLTTYAGTDLHVLPVGSLPPNPSELLYSQRLPAFLEQLRQNYDYIFLDCPPLEVVADSSIIASHADRTLFVARAHLLDRHMLPEIEDYYLTQRYPKMMLLLNGTSEAYKGYGHRRYGYRYGYYGS